MSQQEEDPSHYTRTLVVKPALSMSQMYGQLLPISKSLETACKNKIYWKEDASSEIVSLIPRKIKEEKKRKQERLGSRIEQLKRAEE